MLDTVKGEKNNFVTAILHSVIDREINYVGVEEKYKKELLNKAKNKTASLTDKDYKKNLNNSRINKKIKLNHIKRINKK
jgi:hypothetical protein